MVSLSFLFDICIIDQLDLMYDVCFDEDDSIVVLVVIFPCCFFSLLFDWLQEISIFTKISGMFT